MHVDYHEQGYNNNYFTVPGTTPRNLLLPDQHETLSDTIGRANIAAFDQHHISYFTRDAFDFFYPGYGSSYPAGFGAIAMLTEQGGIGAGRAIESSDGHVLKLRQRIFDHYTTSIATIKKAAEQKALFRRYSFEAMNPKNSKTNTKAYILRNQADPYLGEVIQILLDHGVEVHRADANFTVAEARNYQYGTVSKTAFKKGDYIVSTNQPRHLFINSIMARNLEIEDSVMYDMSTWAAPIAYNLDAYEAKSTISVNKTKVTEWSANKGLVINADAQYCYIIDWSQRLAPRALAKLWEKGYKVRSASEAFSVGNHSFEPGALIIMVGRNLDKKDKIASDLTEIAKATNSTIIGLDSGRMDEGLDIGSGRNRPLKQPKIALMVDAPFSSYTAGQIYYLFDWETQLPIQRIRTSILAQTAMPSFRQRYGRADLNDFDVLILSGGGNDLKHLFKKEQLAAIKDWVQEGGTLIATESAAGFFTKSASKFTNVESIKPPKDSTEKAKYISFDERRDYAGKKRIPGTAMNGHIDTSHPLAFGLKQSLYSLNFGVNSLKPAPQLQTVGYYEKDASKLLAAGYSAKNNLEALAGNTFAGVMPMGRGKVIFLVDNTQYRMFWRGPSRMMQNAAMIVPRF